MTGQSEIGVMVLDDDPFTLQLVTRMLEMQDFRKVTTFDRAQDALESIDSGRNSPDLILFDLNLPEMDGIEFIRHLVSRKYSGRLIVMSGETERVLRTVEALVRAHSIAILGHLQKPLRPEQLRDLMGRLISRPFVGGQLQKKEYSAMDVRAAIDSRELVNHYQPKVDVPAGKVVGVEALVRWQHPTDGLVFPDQFISICEANDLIDDLTRVVLAGGLTQLSVWQRAGLRLRMAINLSMDNLKSPEFADYVIKEAERAGIAPQDIVFEVTESRLMHDARVPLDILTRLRLNRFCLAIDDFGTGHSSLAQLRDIPFNELKIDRSFVHRAWHDSTVNAIYQASVDLGRKLDMDVVAEGVEDGDDWDFVCKTKCTFAQGYFIAKPMPGDALRDWIDAWDERRKGDLNNKRLL